MLHQFNIAWFLELAFDYRTQFWILFPSKECGTGSETQLKVGTARFAQRSLAPFVIQGIIDELDT